MSNNVLRHCIKDLPPPPLACLFTIHFQVNIRNYLQTQIVIKYRVSSNKSGVAAGDNITAARAATTPNKDSTMIPTKMAPASFWETTQGLSFVVAVLSVSCPRSGLHSFHISMYYGGVCRSLLPRFVCFWCLPSFFFAVVNFCTNVENEAVFAVEIGRPLYLPVYLQPSVSSSTYLSRPWCRILQQIFTVFAFLSLSFFEDNVVSLSVFGFFLPWIGVRVHRIIRKRYNFPIALSLAWSKLHRSAQPQLFTQLYV